MESFVEVKWFVFDAPTFYRHVFPYLVMFSTSFECESPLIKSKEMEVIICPTWKDMHGYLDIAIYSQILSCFMVKDSLHIKA
jgi:hypothetical protein